MTRMHRSGLPFLMIVAIGCAKRGSPAEEVAAMQPHENQADGRSGPAPEPLPVPVAEPEPVPEIVAAEDDCIADDCARKAIEFTDADRDRALSMLRRGCDTGGSVSCSMLAVAHEQGRGVTPDLAKAADLYALACDRGYAKACHNLSLLYAGGGGVETDIDRAIELLEKACAGGAFRGCGTLGDYLVHRGEIERARAILERGCAGGDEFSCAALSDLAADAE